MWWTNSMFGGMPSYQISGQTPANKLRVKLEKASHLWLRGNNEPIGILVAYMIGFFIMLMCFDVDPWMSIAGAIALTLSSYFLCCKKSPVLSLHLEQHMGHSTGSFAKDGILSFF